MGAYANQTLDAAGALDRVQKILTVVALASPFVGISFLFGFLEQLGVWAPLIVGPEDLVVASLLAACVVTVLALALLPACALIRLLSGLRLSWADALAILTGLAGASLFIFILMFNERVTVFGATIGTYLIGPSGTLAMVALVAGIIPRAARYMKSERRFVAGLAQFAVAGILSFGLYSSLFTLPREAGMALSFFSVGQWIQLVAQDDVTVLACGADDRASLVWSGERARVLSCNSQTIVLWDDGKKYQVVGAAP